MTFTKISSILRCALLAVLAASGAASMAQTAPGAAAAASPAPAASAPVAPARSASAPQMLEGIDVPKERARIAEARKQSAAQLLAEEKLCYQKFAVTDCVDEAKAKQRVVMSDLRRQEIAINDAERRKKGAEQMKQLDKRMSPEAQQQAADRRAQAVIDEKNRRESAANKSAGKTTHATTDADRAKQQKEKIESKNRANEAREEKAANTAANVEALKKRQADAAEHRAKVAAQNAKKAASGKTVAPLPDPTAPAP